jgi:16S rRNA processing protein RimM
MDQMDDDLLEIGHIIGAHGVRGQVKVFSQTSPRENILNYSPWVIEQAGRQQLSEISGKRQGKNVIASLAEVSDRNAAEELSGAKILIRRGQLPELAAGEYYWSQLIGLQVVNREDVVLGRVEQMMETGANDVMVVQGDRERLIPYVMEDVIVSVDLVQQQIIVDWKEDY